MLQRISLLIFCAFTLVGAVNGQVPGTGFYNLGSFDNRGFDSINLGNLNTHFEIPIVSKPGRGLPFNYSLVYDGLIWSPVTAAGVKQWTPDGAWGFHGELNGTGIIGFTTNDTLLASCPVPPHYGTIYSNTQQNYVYHDSFGVSHKFNYSVYHPCPVDSNGNSVNAPPQISGDGTSTDGSGYTYNGTVHARNGSTANAPATAGASGNLTDANGNQITNNGSGVFTDTTGTAELTIAGGGSPSSPGTFTYPVVNQAGGATTAAITVSYVSYKVQTNFQCANIVDPGYLTVNLVDKISMPDNPANFYKFAYEPTPNVSGAVTGRLKSVTLPAGGTITYSYTGGCSSSGINSDGTTSGLTRTTSDGIKTYVTAAVNANATTTTVTDEAGNVSLFHFSKDSVTSNFYETHRQVYQGSNTSGGNLLDLLTCYNGATGSCDGSTVTSPLASTSTLTSYNNQSQLLTNSTYSNGLLASAIYKSGSSTIMSTANQFNGLGEPTSQIISDPSGTTVSKATYAYDVSSPTATSSLPQHVAVTGTRGNLTSTTVFTSTSAGLQTNYVHDDAGQLLSSTAPNGLTSFTYDSTDTFRTTIALPTPSSGVALTTSETWDKSSGAALTLTGLNANQVSTAQQYDSLLRPTRITLPINGAARTQSYSPTQISASSTLNASQSANQTSYYDGYGRVIRQAVANASGYYITDTCYGKTGLVSSVGVPYASTSLPSSYSCTTQNQYTYDALSRPLSVSHADGSSTSWTYYSRAVQQVDSPGTNRITQYDLVGRLQRVCEVSSSALAGGGQASSCATELGGTGYYTDYAYDLAGHSTTVTQGSQTRTFTTDMAGRIIKTVEPERGTTSDAYAYNSTGLQIVQIRPQANQPIGSTLTTTATTQYDTLNRVISVTYSDGTPTKLFTYDAPASSSVWPEASMQSNLKGMLSSATRNTAAGNTGTIYSYDFNGNVSSMYQCQPSGCGSSPVRHQALSYTYDWGGSLTSESDAAGTTYTFGRSIAGEITGITSSSSDATHPANIVVPNSVVSGPFGPQQYSLGNGINQVYTYDSVGRVNGGFVCSGSSAASCAGGTQYYGFVDNWLGARTTGGCDTINNRCEDFHYDDFSRLTSTTFNTSGTPQEFTWTYDRYGNRYQQNAQQSGPQPQLTFSANNQADTFTYDVAGNLLKDGIHTYSYDADGNMISVDSGNTAAYTFDALNHRVRVQSQSRGTTEFAFDAIGKRVSTWNAPAGTLNEANVYWDGRPVAFKAGGSTHFEHQDWLGTERLRMTYNGAVDSKFTSFAFGDGYSASGNDWDWYHYGGTTHDPESSTENAQFRQYSSTQGHWMSPDPYDGSYDVVDPQSFNRYSYSGNSPLSSVDPLGLVRDDDYGEGVNVYGDDGSYWSAILFFVGGGYGGGSSPTGSNWGSAPSNLNPCALLNSRVSAGIQGALNVGIGTAKVRGASGVLEASLAGTPETAGASLLGIVPAAYVGVSGAGQISVGAGQLYYAFTGRQSSSGLLSAVSQLASPVAGLLTAAGQISPSTGQHWGDIESLLGGPGSVAKTTDFLLSVAGALNNAGCHK